MTDDREKDMAIRQALLMQVDAIERRWGISPTTAEIRKEDKAARKAEGASYGQHERRICGIMDR